jgi:hypothetical protein
MIRREYHTQGIQPAATDGWEDDQEEVNDDEHSLGGPRAHGMPNTVSVP